MTPFAAKHSPIGGPADAWIVAEALARQGVISIINAIVSSDYRRPSMRPRTLPTTHCRITLVVMHQPTRKQEILGPAWGRIRWCDRFRGYTGPVVMIDAIDLTREWLWLGGRAVSVDWRRELERMQRFGLTLDELQALDVVGRAPMNLESPS